MELIKGYLQKITRVGLPDDTLRRLLLEALDQDYKIKLERSQIKIKNGTVIINTSPLIKNEIFIHKTKIIAKIKAVLGDKALFDIR